MNLRNRDNLISALVLGAVFLLAIWAGGCGIFPHKTSPPASPVHGPGSGTGLIIESWMWIGVAGLVAGAVLIVLMKNDRLPTALIAGGATALGISLALKTVLPWLPWLFGAALVVGALWLYARYHDRVAALFSRSKSK